MRLLIIGAGGVGRVVAHKCAAMTDAFSHVTLASRTLEKCRIIADSISTRVIQIAQVDADHSDQVAALIRETKADLVINVALPYQDLSIMDACLETGVHYLDTANYEPPDNPKFEYHWQWAYRDRFKEKGLFALLGIGFDPGVTNVFTAYLAKHYFDEIHTLDILDANGGDHGYPFATNFNPEINIREITANGRYWQDGQWVEIPPMSQKLSFNFPQIGQKEMYVLYHEELESLTQNIKGLRRARFWMTFGEQYLTHLKVLQNVGLTSIEPMEFQGQSIVPLHFLKAILPDPGSLGPRTKGKTNIGVIARGIKNGQSKIYYLYNVCDHQEAFKEVGSQAISYTTGVPAATAGGLIAWDKWKGTGVFNVEEMNPDPFMEIIGTQGLPWVLEELETMPEGLA